MPPKRDRRPRVAGPQRKRTGPRPGRRPDRDSAPVRPAGAVELSNPIVVKDFAETLGVRHRRDHQRPDPQMSSPR